MSLLQLLMRTFPRHYTPNSTYALFPFSTPATTNSVLERLKIVDQYDTRRPGPTATWFVVEKRSIAEAVLSPDSHDFEPVCGVPLDVSIRQPREFNQGERSKDLFHHFSQDVVDRAFFPSQFTNLIVASIAPRAKELVSRAGWSHGLQNSRLDVVQGVLVPVCMEWLCDQLGFPLKPEDDARGLLAPRELYDALCEAYTYVHLE